MQYAKFDKTYYIRADKGDEIISAVLSVLKKENISSAVFSGIGGCSSAEIQTFIPEKSSFETTKIEGMLELVSMQGSITKAENGELSHHTHATFSYIEKGAHKTVGGHIKSITVLYTAEIEVRPVLGGTIKRKTDAETGTGFWDFEK